MNSQFFCSKFRNEFPSRGTALAFAVIFAGGLVPTRLAADVDGDGVPDEVEAHLLHQLAPVWRVPRNNSRPPLPIDWAVEHCSLRWHQSNSKSAPLIADSGNTPQSIGLVLDTMQAHRAAGLNYHYRLSFRSGDFRDGIDPTDPVTWATAEQQGRGLYGRVSPIGGTGKQYRIQYFAFFGFNDTGTPPLCDAGDHEGDWICIEFDVEATDLTRPRIYSAVYHNHGRQIFVESPSALILTGGRPEVFPEAGSQEPWPYSGVQGFLPGEVPPCITVNRLRLLRIDGRGNGQSM